LQQCENQSSVALSQRIGPPCPDIPHHTHTLSHAHLLSFTLPTCNSTPNRGSKHEELESYKEHNNHELCTFDFCEYSQRDFTAVQQRHECKEANCAQLRGRFSRTELERAARSGDPTVWSLTGKALLGPQRPYMAVSHVWSDGMGTGAWPAGEVNECLHAFF